MVWLETCPTLSPVTSAFIPSLSAIFAAARIIMRFRTTPIRWWSIFCRISPTTSSNGTAKNFTRCEDPYFFQMKCASSLTPISCSRPPMLKKQ